MKHIKVILVFVIFSHISLGQEITKTELDCKKFHIGNFQLTGKKSNILITRTETTQTETNVKTGDEYTYTINWLTDCKFQLSPDPKNEKDKEFFKGKTFIGEILSVKDNSYTCKSGFSGEKTTVTDEVRKLGK